MASLSENLEQARAKAVNGVRDAELWVFEHGRTLDGYRRHYGMSYPDVERIYLADVRHIEECIARLMEIEAEIVMIAVKSQLIRTAYSG